MYNKSQELKNSVPNHHITSSNLEQDDQDIYRIEFSITKMPARFINHDATAGLDKEQLQAVIDQKAAAGETLAKKGHSLKILDLVNLCSCCGII